MSDCGMPVWGGDARWDSSKEEKKTGGWINTWINSKYWEKRKKEKEMKQKQKIRRIIGSTHTHICKYSCMHAHKHTWKCTCEQRGKGDKKEKECYKKKEIREAVKQWGRYK